MAKQDTYKRYHLIISLLKRKPCSYNEIEQYIEQEGELRGIYFNFSIRTFKRDREDIASIFGFEIEYNSSLKAYCINQHIQPEVDSRIMEAFDVIDAFNIKTNVSDIVFFDQRKGLGTENIFGILHAIKNNLQISFWYHRYQDDNGSFKETNPYGLKEFKNRWYVLANELESDEIKTFALDRLSNLSILPTKFSNQDKPNINQMFKDCFGIFLPDKSQHLEHIILSFSAFKGKYIKSLKLHSSQKILVDNDNEFRISLDIYITYDFIMELLSHSLDLKVIEPIHLQKTLIEHHKGAINHYKQDHG